MNFLPFPNIETRRLSLNQLHINDFEEIYFLRSDEEVCKYVDHPKAESLNDAKDFINKINNGINDNKWIMWAIRLSKKTKLIGTICLWNFSKNNSKADIGFVLHPKYQNKGIMSEAVTEILKYGFSFLKLNEISGEVVCENIASILLMKKYGFKLMKQKNSLSIYKLKRANLVLPNNE